MNITSLAHSIFDPFGRAAIVSAPLCFADPDAGNLLLVTTGTGFDPDAGGLILVSISSSSIAVDPSAGGLILGSTAAVDPDAGGLILG